LPKRDGQLFEMLGEKDELVFLAQIRVVNHNVRKSEGKFIQIRLLAAWRHLDGLCDAIRGRNPVREEHLLRQVKRRQTLNQFKVSGVGNPKEQPDI